MNEKGTECMQGLDPVGISRVFSSAEYMGEKLVLGTLPTGKLPSPLNLEEEEEEEEGIIISHSGHTTLVITSFGEDNLILRAGHGVTRMEETYTIDDLAFNVPGLSSHTFIPMHLSSSTSSSYFLCFNFRLLKPPSYKFLFFVCVLPLVY